MSVIFIDGLPSGSVNTISQVVYMDVSLFNLGFSNPNLTVAAGGTEYLMFMQVSNFTTLYGANLCDF